MTENEKKKDGETTEEKVEQKTTEEKVEQSVVDVNEKVKEEIEAARRKDDEKKAHDHLGFLKRTNPEAYKSVMEKFAGDGGSAELAEANKRIQKLELDRARERAMRTHNLDDDDEMFLTGTTAEEIETQAQALAERAKKLRALGKGAGDGTGDQKDGENDGKVELPKYDKKSGITEIEFLEEELRKLSH